MKTESVDAKSRKEAQQKMPWAEVIVKVDPGAQSKINRYMGFESRQDYETWRKQK